MVEPRQEVRGGDCIVAVLFRDLFFFFFSFFPATLARYLSLPPRVRNIDPDAQQIPLTSITLPPPDAAPWPDAHSSGGSVYEYESGHEVGQQISAACSGGQAPASFEENLFDAVTDMIVLPRVEFTP